MTNYLMYSAKPRETMFEQDPDITQIFRFIMDHGHIENEIERLHRRPYENRLFRLPEITTMAPDYQSGRLKFDWDETSSAAPPADRGNVIFIKGPRVVAFKQGSLRIEQ